MQTAAEILEVLDAGCESSRFPMLDNGYVFLAATRLSLYRSDQDWAIVFEVFGYSPRVGLPNLNICTFASRLHNRDQPDEYVNQRAYENYIVNNPHNDSRSFFPVEEGPWQDADDAELVSQTADRVVIREQVIRLPTLADYLRHGIRLESPPRVRVFELCRFLAGEHRERVLATPLEQRVSVLPEMKQLLQLEEWRHPDMVECDLASQLRTFKQLAAVLATGDVGCYRTTAPPNTHWRHWPEGGRL